MSFAELKRKSEKTEKKKKWRRKKYSQVTQQRKIGEFIRNGSSKIIIINPSAGSNQLSKKKKKKSCGVGKTKKGTNRATRLMRFPNSVGIVPLRELEKRRLNG